MIDSNLTYLTKSMTILFNSYIYCRTRKTNTLMMTSNLVDTPFPSFPSLPIISGKASQINLHAPKS